jgi:hypothetical protein
MVNLTISRHGIMDCTIKSVCRSSRGFIISCPMALTPQTWSVHFCSILWCSIVVEHLVYPDDLGLNFGLITFYVPIG